MSSKGLSEQKKKLGGPDADRPPRGAPRSRSQEPLILIDNGTTVVRISRTIVSLKMDSKRLDAKKRSIITQERCSFIIFYLSLQWSRSKWNQVCLKASPVINRLAHISVKQLKLEELAPDFVFMCRPPLAEWIETCVTPNTRLKFDYSYKCCTLAFCPKLESFSKSPT